MFVRKILFTLPGGTSFPADQILWKSSCRRGKTTILIAHRVTTIESMDKIIFIDDGKMLAVGTHEELYKSCPEYKLTVDLQRLEDENGGAQNA